MITLYTFPEAFGLRNVSPFCLKVEMALKHLELPHRIELQADPRQAPKGKLPYIDIDGQIIPDSEIIFEHLDEMTNGALFGQLSPQERAQGTAVTRLLEDHLYWMMVASRWLDDDWWPNVKAGFFASMPLPVRTIVGPLARRQMRQTYNLHGLGRHSLDEQKAFAARDLKAIADMVADTGYVVAGRLTAFDFTTASMIAGLIDNKPATWLTRLADEQPALREYAERIQAEVGVYGRVDI